MFVNIVGTEYSGKDNVLHYFLAKGFIHLRLEDEVNESSTGNQSTSQDATLSFASYSSMLDFATKNWLSNFVTCALTTRPSIQAFSRRPFFLLLEVRSPLMLKWTRYCTKHSIQSNDASKLLTFLSESDKLEYGFDAQGDAYKDSTHNVLADTARVTILNTYTDEDAFQRHLDSLDLLNQERLRPGWDSYFMTLSELAAQRSNCMKRRVGAILVRKNRILATGYNGTPRGLKNCNEGGCSRCNGLARSGEALDECLCLHAEENALLEAGRERVGDGAVLYCNTCPCLRCSVKIVQTGVQEVVYNLAYSMDDASAKVFEQAGVKLRQHSPPQY